MILYFRILQFEFARFLAYPHEIFFSILKRVVEIGLLIYFWSLVLENNNQGLELKSLLSYFLIANAVANLTMAYNTSFGRSLRYLIKYGSISTILTKPVRILPYIYFSTLGQQSIRMFTASMFLIAGIAIEQPSIKQLVLFFISFIFAAFSAIAFNILEGIIAFLITEVSGIKNAIRHISNILSGNLVPLYFFPASVLPFVLVNPFALMVFVPTQFLQENFSFEEILYRLGFGLFWAIFLNITVLKFWNWASKKYEATGS